jgi:DNA polymerase alpha subunit A
LLHEFHRLKYVCPDKGEGKPSSRSAKKVTLDGQGNVMVEPKKNKYQGGLVFEPKRGLWDTYVMVMDFNSLYPSIIQEYNIDFTTVDRDPDAVSHLHRIEECGCTYDIVSSRMRTTFLMRLQQMCHRESYLGSLQR